MLTTLKWVALALALVLPIPASAQPSPEVKMLHERVISPTVRIDDNCSGQIISSDRDNKSGDVTTYVLTAAHCVKGAQRLYEIDVPYYDRKNRVISEHTYFAYLAFKSGEADLAILRLKDRDTWFDRVVKVAPADIEMYQGDEVMVAGYPKAMEFTLTKGLLGPLVEIEHKGRLTEFYRATPKIEGGNSGGGLYHRDADGNWVLVGISTAAIPATHMGIFTPLPAIVKFLRHRVPSAVAE